MATLLDIPNEVLDDILSYLKTRQLIALAGVSRRFHSLSLPVLYKAPVLRAWSGFRPPALPRFLRTLMAVPSLATHVRLLQLQLAHFPPRPDLYPDTYSMPQAASRPGSEDPQPTQGPQLEQLLCMVPRLMYLELWPLEYPDNYGSGLMRFSELLHDPMTLPLSLQNLREFRAVGGMGITSLLLVAVMTLPSICIIAVTVTQSDAEDISSLTIAIAVAINSSSVTGLYLVDSRIPYPVLTAILTVPRALTYFEFQSLSMQMYFDFVGFREALEPLIPTLQHLSISCAKSDLWEVNDWSRIAETLHRWPTLQTLRCPMMALIGRMPLDYPRLVDMLPIGLRALCITKDIYWSTESVVEMLVTLLEQGQMGSLREMKLQLVGGTENEGDGFRRFRQACEDAKVALVVKWQPGGHVLYS